MNNAQALAYIVARSRALGLDPRAVKAVGRMEGFSGRVGDGGHAFGPFQENNAGGVLTGKFPGASQQQLQKWAWSKAGINDALSRMSRVAGGLQGNAAVNAIVSRFERPANPGREIAGAEAAYGNIGTLTTPPSTDGKGGMGPIRPPASMAMTGLGGLNGGGQGLNGINAMKAMLVQQMLGASKQAFSGDIAGSGNSLLQMVNMRNALQNADSLGMSSASAPAAFHAGSHGSGGPTPAVKGLDGTFQMQTGGKSPYSNLRFASGVDWMHVNPRLLKSVNAVAAAHGVVVDINSGYRSNAHSLKVGGFAGDPHTRGHAIDAYVNGKPIGAVLPANIWSKYGVQSGAVPNFYHGQEDPEHLQI